jgi:hypothetical protein
VPMRERCSAPIRAMAAAKSGEGSAFEDGGGGAGGDAATDLAGAEASIPGGSAPMGAAGPRSEQAAETTRMRTGPTNRRPFNRLPDPASVKVRIATFFTVKARVRAGAQQSNEFALVESAGLGAVAQLVEHLLGRRRRP